MPDGGERALACGLARRWSCPNRRSRSSCCFRIWARSGRTTRGRGRAAHGALSAPPAPPSLERMPPPRYDLVEHRYAVSVVTEATRGCPFKCTYCQLNIRPLRFRCRPIEDGIAALTATARLPYPRRKLGMLYDNNLGGDMGY